MIAVSHYLGVARNTVRIVRSSFQSLSARQDQGGQVAIQVTNMNVPIRRPSGGR